MSTCSTKPAPPAPFDLTGIGGQFDSSTPYTEGYQIAPRYIADVSSLVKTKTVDFSDRVQISPNPATEFLRIQTDLDFRFCANIQHGRPAAPNPGDTRPAGASFPSAITPRGYILFVSKKKTPPGPHVL
jgi:hypothetical protein